MARYSMPECVNVAEDRRHFVVRDDVAVFLRQLDQHRPLSVVDLADRRNLEPDEALEIGQTAPIEIDVVDEPDGRNEEQQERSRQDSAATPRHASGGCGPSDREAIHRKQDDRADDRHDEADGIAFLVQTDETAHEPTDDSAHDPDEGSDDETTRIAPWHEELGDDPDDQTEHDPSNDVHGISPRPQASRRRPS
jgi:hypothetical protein